MALIYAVSNAMIKLISLVLLVPWMAQKTFLVPPLARSQHLAIWFTKLNGICLPRIVPPALAPVVGYLPSTDSNGPFALGVRADLILRFGRTEAGGAIRAGDPSERP